MHKVKSTKFNNFYLTIFVKHLYLNLIQELLTILTLSFSFLLTLKKVIMLHLVFNI